VVFAVPELTNDRDRTVYVDPYTGQIRGQLTTWFGSTPITTWLDDLHRHLHLGEPGRLYTELAASWVWVLVLGGLVLWWQRQRRPHNGSRNGRGRVRRMIHPDLSPRWAFAGPAAGTPVPACGSRSSCSSCPRRFAEQLDHRFSQKQSQLGRPSQRSGVMPLKPEAWRFDAHLSHHGGMGPSVPDLLVTVRPASHPAQA
jgi:hypothetical protein